MKNPLLFLALITLVLTGCLKSEKQKALEAFLKEGPPVQILEPTPQEAKERVFRPIALERVWVIGEEAGEGPLEIFTPKEIQVDVAGDFYVLDQGDMRAKKFSLDGTLLTTYGRGEGEGPGEMTSVWDFDVAPDGTVTILDGQRQKVSLFAANGAFRKSFEVDRSSNQVIAGEDGEVVVLNIQMETLLNRYNLKGKRLEGYGRFFEDQARYPVVLKGTLVRPNPHGDILYISFYSGNMASFSAEGELQYYVASIDPQAFPQWGPDEEIGEITLKSEDGAPVFGFTAPVHRDLVYVFTMFGNPLRLILDVYNVYTGAYQFSIELKEACMPAAITDAHIYAICKTDVAKFAYRFEDQP